MTVRDGDERDNGHQQTPAENGMWIFILGDMSVFALFFGAYLWSFGEHRDEFVVDAQDLMLSLGLINTLILLSSSYAVVRALDAFRGSRDAEARRMLVWALIGAGSFALIKITEYTLEVRSGNGLTTSKFFMYYFVLTGLHLMHVAIGSALLLVWMRSIRGRGGFSRGWAEGVAGYWHMVDLLWILIFSFFYIGSHA